MPASRAATVSTTVGPVVGGDRLLTVAEVAHHLGFSRKWVYENHYRLPHFRVHRELRFRASEVDDWLEQHCRSGRSTRSE